MYNLRIIRCSNYVFCRQITIIPLTSSVKEWSLKVEDGREILCIASSSKLVCFSTSNYLVHLCTVYGTQKAVISIPGPVVSMAAFEDVLLIAYHTSLPRKDDQCISMMLVRFEGICLVDLLMIFFIITTDFLMNLK